MEDQLEARFSGMLPYNMPYYLSWRTGTLEDDKTAFKAFSARVSKQVKSGLNFTLEDNYYDYENGSKPYNTIRWGVYTWKGHYSSETWLDYATSPKTELTEFSTRVDYRSGRNTYISGKYTRDIQNKMDYFSVSSGQIFPFGGLTLTLETDRKMNLSTYLTWSISLAKEPERKKIISSANSKLSQSGTIYAKIFDENSEPIEGVGLNANGLEKEVYTDENGVAVLRDLPTYEKVILNIDSETLSDVALQPQTEEKKLVLHPGTIRTVEIPFTHRGAVEGKLNNPRNMRMFGYKIAVVDKDRKELYHTYADIEGYFILDNVAYGTYNLIISKEENILAELQDIKVDDLTVFLPDEIMITSQSIEFFEDEENMEEPKDLDDWEEEFDSRTMMIFEDENVIELQQLETEKQPEIPKTEEDNPEETNEIENEPPPNLSKDTET